MRENLARRNTGLPPSEKVPRPTRPVVNKIQVRDPRLPPAGTVLEREFKGETVRVPVLEIGFIWKNRHYRSLSAVANAITGAKRNGFEFFRLVDKPGARPP